ncbi:MAG: aldehyde dehydrogenase family protein [Methanomicrobiales archaeon]|nr:aldehyde dehydrogenase family protein [Methanomicrobiales archaeon]
MTSQKKITYVSLLSDESIHGEFETALESIGREFGKSHPMMIDGKEITADREFDVFSPIDRSIHIGRFQQGTGQDAAAAVAAARSGFISWSETGWQERAGRILRVADVLEEEMFLLAALITFESGKNRYEALAEVGEAVDMLRYYAETYRTHQGYRIPMVPEQPGAICESVMRPYGVWAVISPFNFPLALGAGMAGAALLTGNTVVLKPTSTAPFSGLKLYHAFITAGVPAGSLQFFTGPGKVFGSAIVKNRDIDGIAFTGSRDAGMWLQRNFVESQPYPKPVVSEMGSKNPAIVTANADIDTAVEGIVKGAFGYSGQKCSATSRVYVHQNIATEFTEALVSAVDRLVIDDPRKKESFISPVISEKALTTFRDAVTRCRKDGGTILAGGTVLEEGIFSRGHYIRPTVVTGLPPDHSLVADELFVPFLILDTFATLGEALEKANTTEYGLTAGIFSRDTGEINEFFRKIRFGVCYSNRRGGATTGAWPGSQPFGGWKASGSTGRGVGGPYYLLSYLHEQAQTRL